MPKQIKLSGKSILIAEDNLENQELMKDIFEMFDCQFDIVENGEEALKKYQSNSYDLVILDIQMPIKDGYEVAREIRSLENQQHALILGLTANALTSTKHKCLDAGMDDYMAKPIDIDSFEKKLIQLFQRSNINTD